MTKEFTHDVEAACVARTFGGAARHGRLYTEDRRAFHAARMLVFRIGSPTVSLGWIKR
jgi:hypothetical protein